MFDGIKPGPGRPPGAKNKNTLIKELLGDDYPKLWAEQVRRISLDEQHKDQVAMLSLAGKKMFPDLKAIEVSGELDTNPEKMFSLTEIGISELEGIKEKIQAYNTKADDDTNVD